MIVLRIGASRRPSQNLPHSTTVEVRYNGRSTNLTLIPYFTTEEVRYHRST